MRVNTSCRPGARASLLVTTVFTVVGVTASAVAQPNPAGKPASAAATPPAAAPPAAAPPAAVLEREPVVTLVSPGSEPRAELRYKVPAGVKQKTRMDMTMTMQMGMQGAPPNAIKMPRMRMVMEMQSTDASADAFKTISKIVAVEVLKAKDDKAEMVDRIRKELGSMVGMTVNAEVTPRGFVRKFEFKMPEGASPQVAAMAPQLRASIQQAMAAFPEEPVGNGAKWRVEAAIDSGPMKMQQVTLMTLKSRKGNRASVDLEIDQTAPKQAMQAPGVPAGTKIDLESYKGTGKGRMDIDVTKLAPKVQMNLVSDTGSKVTAQDRNMALTMKMNLDMTMAPQ